MIFVLFFAIALTAGLVLCWLSARHDDRVAARTLPSPTPARGWPNERRACRRAVNQ